MLIFNESYSFTVDCADKNDYNKNSQLAERSTGTDFIIRRIRSMNKFAIGIALLFIWGV